MLRYFIFLLYPSFVLNCEKAINQNHYNLVIGTQTIGAKYQFTKEPRLLETAKEIQKLGSNILKFRLDQKTTEENYLGSQHSNQKSLVELASKNKVIQQVWNMPFSYYFMWVDPLQDAAWADSDGYTKRDQEIEYQELYDLACYLLKKFSDSGKSFYFGNWEGDWLLLGSYNRTQSPTNKNISNMIKWFNNRQKALDDAKRDTPHKNVALYHYIEVNLVEKALRGQPSLVNSVLPHTNVDFVSYSSYEIGNDYDFPTAMNRTLGYIEQQLKPKKDISGKRVFIGEFGYKSNLLGPDVMVNEAVDFMKAAMEWGCPFILYWQIYDNEIVEGQYNGYWLIDHTGKKWPLYDIIKSYLSKSKNYFNNYLKKHNEHPTWESFKFKASQLITDKNKEKYANSGLSFYRDFESGDLSGVVGAGHEFSIDQSQPFKGQYHLKLSASDSENSWAVAYYTEEAQPSQVWKASVRALRKSGIMATLKLEFFDKNDQYLNGSISTGVKNDEYMPLELSMKAPTDTAFVRLVMAVEHGSIDEPAVAYFDDAELQLLNKRTQ